MGMSLSAVKRYNTYLKDLAVADLTAKEIADKRSEIYLELVEATGEARDMFMKYKQLDEALQARRFFSAWIEAIQLRAKLYGLDNMKVESFTQFNTQVNARPVESDTIDRASGAKLAEMIKKNHERSVIEEYDEN